MAAAAIDPSALGGFHAPSPAPSSSCTHDDENDDEAGPSRKRPRTSSTDSTKEPSLSEQRKEARAHRNRIAAQNSRDRRKAQFSFLERRVAELEDENRRLRAGIHVPASPSTPAQTPVYASQLALSNVLEDRLRAERERERERENAELKERIHTLERAWDTVMKAITAQGLPAALGTAPVPSTPAIPVVATSIPLPTTTTKPAYTAFPSPAPSHSSLDLEPITPVSSPVATAAARPRTNADSTRHLARVATTGGPSLVRSVSLQRVVSDVVPAPAAPAVMPPYLRALQRKRMNVTATRSWRTSSARYVRRRVRSTRSPCVWSARR